MENALSQNSTYEPEVRQIAEIIQQKLGAGGVSHELTSIALHPYQLLNDIQSYCPSFREKLNYLSLYSEIILHLDFFNNFSRSPDQVLSDGLISLGYNHILFLNYFTNRIGADLKSVESTKQKLLILKLTRLRVNQLPLMNFVNYHPSIMPINSAILNWIEFELNFWKVRAKNEKKSNDPAVREKLNLAVPQMAYFARLSVKHDIFMEKSPVLIARHMVRTYNSKATENISEGSFLKHFHKKPADSTARVIRKILRKMIDDVDDFLRAG